MSSSSAPHGTDEHAPDLHEDREDAEARAARQLVAEPATMERDPGLEGTDDERAAEGASTTAAGPPTYVIQGSGPDDLSEEQGEDDDLPDDRFADRELSWLAFNQRVLEQAEDQDLPILERAWFLGIFASNLDEYFMVRVAGLKRRISTGMAVPGASGLGPRQVLDRIGASAQELMARHAKVFLDDVQPKLAEEGIDILHWGELADSEKERLHKFFRTQIFPVLTPLAVDPAHPFPYISGLSLNLAVLVRNPTTGTEHFARVKVPALLARFIAVDAEGRPYRPEDVPEDAGGRTSYVPLEEIIGQHLDALFPGMDIVEHHTFRVTRNEDLEVEEDDAENLLQALEKELSRRRFGAAVRLEVEEHISERVLDLLARELGIGEQEIYRLPAPLDLTGLNVIHDLDRPHLKFKKYVPVTAAGLAKVESANPTDIFAAIRERDVLLHHPYDSFSTSVQQFLQQAAVDPKVLAIKQTLYRTSGDSPIVDALIEAAEAGKQVLAIVEIKARFDEQANIEWARKLEESGVHVVYGIVGLKTHCKLSMVVRQEADGLRRYCHVGTGNYHPKTARGYEDIGMFTCHRDVGQDLTRLFNQLSGYAPSTSYHRLLVAPRDIRPGLLDGIDREIAHHEAGRPAWIKIKVNSIVDERLIDALYRASRAGVPVDVVVRGICGIKVGLPGTGANLRVRSILGRFLEHSRIFAFNNDGDPQVWIGSADLMHRNLDRRVEALIRIVDPGQRERLIEVVDLAASDDTASWRLGPDGWSRVAHDADGNRLRDVQQHHMRQARRRVASSR